MFILNSEGNCGYLSCPFAKAFHRNAMVLLFFLGQPSETQKQQLRRKSFMHEHDAELLKYDTGWRTTSKVPSPSAGEPHLSSWSTETPSRPSVASADSRWRSKTWEWSGEQAGADAHGDKSLSSGLILPENVGVENSRSTFVFCFEWGRGQFDTVIHRALIFGLGLGWVSKSCNPKCKMEAIFQTPQCWKERL